MPASSCSSSVHWLRLASHLMRFPRIGRLTKKGLASCCVWDACSWKELSILASYVLSGGAEYGPRRSSPGGGFCFPVHVELILRHVLFDLLDCALVCIAVLFLKQADEDIELTRGPFQIVVREFAPPGFGPASDLFPFACKYICVHRLVFLWFAL